MSVIKDVFFNLFWQSKACQNLFLLSKEELLDNINLEILGINKRVALPRIIISNIESKEHENYEAIKIRNENSNIRTESILNSKIQFYEPIVTQFLESKFGKSIEKVIAEYNENDKAFWEKIINAILSKNTENELITLLQYYGFIGKQINNFKELENYFNKEGISKVLDKAITDQNFKILLDFVKGLKDLYLNQIFKNLYESNQILLNSLHLEDDFESRIKLFSLLYESKIIYASREDAFVECTECDSGAYRGILQLTVNPKRLKEFKCPICSSKLSYYVPYELNNEIFNYVKRKDGLIQSALEDLLDRKEIKYEHANKYLKNIEIDCKFQYWELEFVVECKMYVKNVGNEKLKTKIRSHFGKLKKDLTRLIEAGLFDLKVRPILLVNINDTDLLGQIESELKEKNTDAISQTIQIMNIQGFKTFLDSI